MPDEQPLEHLAQRFEYFGTEVFLLHSPLYQKLSLRIAADPEILALAAHARRKPVPNLFLGAVHFLLLKGSQHPLSAYYPSINGTDACTADPYPDFRSFCLEHGDEIRRLITTRLVQTNEVRRCASLLPAFALVSRRAGDSALVQLEIGASAGLMLLWDRYGYHYGSGRNCGDRDSTVQISCELRGANLPPLPSTLPRVTWRAGIDLDPVDLADPEDVLWLRALIWPEHNERAELLVRAVQLAQHDPPPVLKGDVFALLPDILGRAPPDAVLCIYHSHTVNQFSPQEREDLSSLIRQSTTGRDVFQLSLEWLDPTHQTKLELISDASGARQQELLAYCGGHGHWLEWLQT